MSDPECPKCEAAVPEVGWDDTEATCPACGYVSDVDSDYIDNDSGWIVTLVEKPTALVEEKEDDDGEMH